MTGQSDTRAGRAAEVDRLLAAACPVASIELDFTNPFELLVATILSAQCTDARVNLVTPGLFRRYPDAVALAAADLLELETLIRSTGFYRNKAKSLLGMAHALVDRHGGTVPADMAALTAMPGVGRKTANVVLGIAFGLPSGIVVDTHVARVSRRLGLTTGESPEAIEVDLMADLPNSCWVGFGSRMVLHGRRVCRASKPDCEGCVLTGLCPRVGV